MTITGNKASSNDGASAVPMFGPDELTLMSYIAVEMGVRVRLEKNDRVRFNVYQDREGALDFIVSSCSLRYVP